MTQNQNDNVHIERLNEGHVARLAWLALDHRVTSEELSTHLFKRNVSYVRGFELMRDICTDLLEKNTRRDGTRVFAIFNGDDVAGCVSRSIGMGTYGNVYNLNTWVGVDHRRKGVGSTSLTQIMAHVRKNAPGAAFISSVPADSRTGFGLMAKAGLSFMSEGPVGGNGREAIFDCQPGTPPACISRIG